MRLTTSDRGQTPVSKSGATEVLATPEDIEKDYFAIPLENVRAATVLTFDLHLVRQLPDGGNRLVLYRGSDTPLTDEHVQRLVDSGVVLLYVRRSERRRYRRYLESNLSSILVDNTVQLDKKASVVYEAAVGLVEDVFDNPASADSVERSKSLVDHTVNHIVKEKNAANHFLAALATDYTTYTHSVNVCVYSLALGSHLSLSGDELNNLALGSLLHDVGKTRIDSAILQKPGPLTREEWEIIRRHPQYGVDILKAGPQLPEPVYAVVLQHHEKCNGSGYPQGLTNGDIHPFAKVACLLDVFDALTTNRPYAQAVSGYEALRVMRDDMRGCFRQDLWRQFILLLGGE